MVVKLNIHVCSINVCGHILPRVLLVYFLVHYRLGPYSGRCSAHGWTTTEMARHWTACSRGRSVTPLRPHCRCWHRGPDPQNVVRDSSLIPDPGITCTPVISPSWKMTIFLTILVRSNLADVLRVASSQPRLSLETNTILSDPQQVFLRLVLR